MSNKKTQISRDWRQTAIGLTLAGCVITAWLFTHVFSVFYYQWQSYAIFSAPLLFALMSWLYVGLFIIAHDCMHGSLAPFHSRLNKEIGRFCLFIYAGFHFGELNRKHHLHHRHAGTENDPDFDTHPPHQFLYWYWNFFTEYFGWPQVLFLSLVTFIYLFVLQVDYLNLVVFWALPAITSSLQLFYFGTYLPHRPGKMPFADHHRSRSNDYNWLLSLLTCFHFGYHHEHHLYPSVPWWRLPAAHDNKGAERPSQKAR